VPSRPSTLKRLWHEASFTLFAALNFLRAGRPDVIVLFTPPFFLGFIGAFFAKLWRRPLVINIQDLPLDAAVALGMVKTGFASRLLLRLERWIYRQADQVVTISESMLQKVWSKGVPQSRTRLVPNWIDVAAASEPVPRHQFRSLHPETQGKLLVAYAGNIGVKQGVDILVHLAHELAGDSRFHFLVAGDGADKSRLLALARELQVSNLTFLPFLKPDAYRQLLADTDLVFIAQRGGAGNNFFPSKLLGLLCQRKALLVAADADSELAKAIVAGGFGLVSPYEDLTGLRRNLERYAGNEVSVTETGTKGLDAVRKFDRQPVLQSWLESIRTLVRPRT
jgi:colanic acid biosynthesis glycosyl transferase WcaI